METSNYGFPITKENLANMVEKKGFFQEDFKSIEHLIAILKTSPTHGLTKDKEELKNRAKHFGENYIQPEKQHGFFYYVLKAINEPILIFLSVAAIVIFIVDMATDPSSYGVEGIAIAVAVLVIITVTAVNDFKKEKQFQKLQKSIKTSNICSVKRDGEIIELFTKELVVGDLLIVKYGDQAPADAILVSCNDLRIDESVLTGESVTVLKNLSNNPYIYSGTSVTEGSGLAIIVAVGILSTTGRIMKLCKIAQEDDKKSKKNKNTPKSKWDENLLPGEQNDAEAKLIQKNKKESTKIRDKKSVSILQEKLTELATLIGKAGLCAGILVTVVLIIRFCVKTYTGPDKMPFIYYHLVRFLEFVVVGLTIVIVAVPEGLPLAVTLSLAYSVNKMLKENNLVRQLFSCETMGNATTICSDKTGTLTTNRMTVEQCYIHGCHVNILPKQITLPDEIKSPLCMNICLNKSAGSIIQPSEHISGLPKYLGNSTDCSLLGMLSNLNTDLNYWESKYPLSSVIKIFPFNSSKKRMSIVIDLGNGMCRVCVKGAPDVLLSCCSNQLMMNENTALIYIDKINVKVSATLKSMTTSALRTILLAYKDVPINSLNDGEVKEEELMNDLTLLCIVGIADPVRPDVPEAIRICNKAGVTVRMVTGDNLITAVSIAMKCGIIQKNSNDVAMDATTFNKLIRDEKNVINQSKMDKVWPKLRVLARSSPEDKCNLVDGIINSKLKDVNEVVAVTGDGTNDAPALKHADVGFSMGISGTDIAKAASDIVLMDDSFASIVRALLWGRNVYDSISKFLQFQLTVNVVAIVSSIITSMLYGVNVLKASQLLWVNLLMDSLASLALATDSPTDDLLNRLPYGRKRSLLSSHMIRFIILHSFYQITIVLLLTFLSPRFFNINNGFEIDEFNKIHSLPEEDTQHLTIIFNTFVFMQFFNLFNARKVHGERNVFYNIHKNYIYLIISIIIVVVQVLIVQFTYKFFHVVPLTLEQWMWCIFIASFEMVYHQIVVLLVIKCKIPKKYRDIKGIPSKEVVSPENTQFIPKLIWLRGLRRLQTQLRVIEAFKYAVEHPCVSNNKQDNDDSTIIHDNNNDNGTDPNDKCHFSVITIEDTILPQEDVIFNEVNNNKNT